MSQPQGRETMTLEEAVRKMLEDYENDVAVMLPDIEDLTCKLAKRIEPYGIAMHDRGNGHRKPWGYVPEDQQEKARHAAVVAFGAVVDTAA